MANTTRAPGAQHEGNEMSEQARDTANGAVRQARNALSDTADSVKNLANDAAERAQLLAREAGAAAESLYNSDMRANIERAVVENPWAALLVAGALGYGIARLMRGR